MMNNIGRRFEFFIDKSARNFFTKTFPERVNRPNESVETKRARLLYQSRKRGILECDLIFSTFADQQLGKMSNEDLNEYDLFLDENDWDLYYWISGERKASLKWEGSKILAMCREHFKKGNLNRMPDLKFK
jgi:succinate dehydrogenase assembly factor 2